ncbi:Hypothetical predicted protein [Xyrichtys novacula]|uniref:Uncharacterized protein n=1 Tax=Xyrichtys novacula TaxID=13765 RepID=A0AAV1HG50_XYRNO|nr:Hypothetical predicted protein [Xyrichtys novacula]
MWPQSDTRRRRIIASKGDSTRHKFTAHAASTGEYDDDGRLPSTPSSPTPPSKLNPSYSVSSAGF